MQTKHRFQARIVIARKTDLKSQSKRKKNKKLFPRQNCVDIMT